MKELLGKIIRGEKDKRSDDVVDEALVTKKVSTLFSVLADIHGSEQLVLRAGKLDALHLMRSSKLTEQVLALERLVNEDPTIGEERRLEEIGPVLDSIEDQLADALARRSVEEEIEKKVSERVQRRHFEYVRDIRAQLIREEIGPDNAQTLKKYAELEILEHKHLSRSAMEMMSPTNLDDVIGQDQAIRALLSKLSSPYPQHILVYGPPGVGKTTVARLALEQAKQRAYTPFAADSPFVEVDGSTLRWDPREVTNPLLGSVHDPIYQGAKRELAEGAVPEPKLGLVTEAHGGVLFIDEIGELDAVLQNKLLKVLEDKRVLFESSYYDPDDPQVPKYIRKLFAEGAPADFLLIGATTRDPSEINPALRSRCAEVFFDPLTPLDIRQIVANAANRMDVQLAPQVVTRLAEYTTEGRQAVRLLADAYSVALYRAHEAAHGQTPEPTMVTEADLQEVALSSRLTPYSPVRGSEELEVGRVFGLGVCGFLGSLLEIEAVAFRSKQPGKGLVRFNDTAGSMAKDSVFNAASVFRRLTGEELCDYDIHVNVVGGGRIDGPSAGVAILLAIYSAVRDLPIPQDLAVTGEISLQGKVKPIGGLQTKIYGARQAGVRKVFVPAANQGDVRLAIPGVEIVPVTRVEEILRNIFS